ncbi:hypothetical protein [Streptomyces sp. NPDC004629]|uniref:hypothetical protein n=1 Tax=Streptomyces sp. NPDC004629 TaxID=3364705 RepID=UPI0036954AD0
MRNDTFVPFVMDCVKNTPGVSRVQTLAEAGDTKHPRGIVVTVGSKETRWQFNHQLADGEKHDTPTAEVDGQPAAWTDTTVQDGGEEWLAAVIGRAESPKIAKIDRWSTREDSSGGEGVTVFFHNGSRAFIRRI